MASAGEQIQPLYEDICGNVDPDQVVPHLLSVGVLNFIDWEKINSSQRRKCRVECLLDILIRSDPALMPVEHFKDSLSSKYPSIASKIKVERIRAFCGSSSVKRKRSKEVASANCRTNNMIVTPDATMQPSVDRPLNSIVVNDQVLSSIAERLFCITLQGDWSTLTDLITQHSDGPNVDVVNYVRITHVLKELLTRDRNESVVDLMLPRRDLIDPPQGSHFPTLSLAGTLTLQAWCLAHQACLMQHMGLKHSAEGLRADSLALLDQANGCLLTLAPCHATCFFYMIYAIVYLINHSLERNLTPDVAERVQRLNARAMDHIRLAEENGGALIDSIKRLCRIHHAGALLNFPTAYIIAGIPPPLGLDAPSAEKLKAARTIIKQVREDLSGVERRCEAYFYLLCSTADLFSGDMSSAECHLQQVVHIMHKVPGSGPKEAVTAMEWFENNRRKHGDT